MNHEVVTLTQDMYNEKPKCVYVDDPNLIDRHICEIDSEVKSYLLKHNVTDVIGSEILKDIALGMDMTTLELKYNLKRGVRREIVNILRGNLSKTTDPIKNITNGVGVSVSQPSREKTTSYHNLSDEIKSKIKVDVSNNKRREDICGEYNISRDVYYKNFFKPPPLLSKQYRDLSDEIKSKIKVDVSNNRHRSDICQEYNISKGTYYTYFYNKTNAENSLSSTNIKNIEPCIKTKIGAEYIECDKHINDITPDININTNITLISINNINPQLSDNILLSINKSPPFLVNIPKNILTIINNIYIR